jgi:hypothetical protein
LPGHAGAFIELARLTRKSPASNKGSAAAQLGVTDELDIYLTANALVKEYGPEQAPLMAATRADALLDLGDIDGQRVWKEVLRAVRELIRRDRKPYEQLN